MQGAEFRERTGLNANPTMVVCSGRGTDGGECLLVAAVGRLVGGGRQLIFTQGSTARPDTNQSARSTSIHTCNVEMFCISVVCPPRGTEPTLRIIPPIHKSHESHPVRVSRFCPRQWSSAHLRGVSNCILMLQMGRNGDGDSLKRPFGWLITFGVMNKWTKLGVLHIQTVLSTDHIHSWDGWARNLASTVK